MANTINALLKILFQSKLVDTSNTLANQPDQVQSGTQGFAALDKGLSFGTGANQAKFQWYKQSVLAGSGTDTWDLLHLTNRGGGALAFANLKWVIVAIPSPVTGNRLLVGNYGANGFVGWMPNNTTTDEVRDVLIRTNNIDGWTVDASHEFLQINNPTGSSITYNIALVGY